MPRYDFNCPTCEIDFDVLITYAHLQLEGSVTCPECLSTEVTRYFPSPNIIGKAAYRDGAKRRGWSELREASKLGREKRKAEGRGDRKEAAAIGRTMDQLADKAREKANK